MRILAISWMADQFALRHTDVLSDEDLTMSKPVTSRRAPNVKYVYAQYRGKALTIQSSPQVQVLAGISHFGSKRRINVGLGPDEDSQAFFNLLERIESAIQDKSVQLFQTTCGLQEESYPHFKPKVTMREQLSLSVAKDVQLFSSTDKAPLQNSSLMQPDNLTGRLVRFIVKLDGIYIMCDQDGDSSVSYWPIWTITQLLVYPEVCKNPLGKQYCFLDDSDYDSLDD